MLKVWVRIPLLLTKVEIFMRIKSSFKDYYDEMQAYVYGSAAVWHREWSAGSSLGYAKKCNYGSHYVVGFCGKIYGYISAPYEKRVDGKREIFDRYHHSVDDYIKYNPRHEKREMEVRRYLSDFFFVKEDNTPFIQNNCLVFYDGKYWDYYRTTTTIYLRASSTKRIDGPSLQDIAFDRILSKEDAYTQLTSYLGFLGTEHKVIPEMSDKVKIQQHGFDKDSFRGKYV